MKPNRWPRVMMHHRPPTASQSAAKKAKAAKKAASATVAMAASLVAVDEEIHKMLAETSRKNKEGRERDEVRWLLMLNKIENKLELKRSKAKTTKIKADATTHYKKCVYQ
jgi:hypothetical protein